MLPVVTNLRAVPLIVFAIPIYLVDQQIHLLDTRIGLALILCLVNFPLVLVLVVNSLRDLPVAIEEAARMDGAGTLAMLLRVVLPLSAPVVASALTLSFIYGWNEFLFGLMLTTERAVPITVGASFFFSDVNENMLGDAFDLARMRDGLRRIGRLAQDAAFQSICQDIQIGNTGLPLADMLDAPDATLDEWLLTGCNHSQHGAGGCCMGPKGTTYGVVDPQCRVHGFSHLRVIDASIMPRDCKANTALTTIMIGEKMADAIRQDVAAA